MSRVAGPLVLVALTVSAPAALSPALAGQHDALIAKHAAANGVPEVLVRRVIQIESRGNPSLAHAGNYGLMQIRLGTARGLGYSGDAKGLLDPETNLTYAVRYLAGAYRAANCNADRAVRYYQRGYYGVRQSKCAAALQIAQVEARPVDVIRPRVVRTETIGAASEAAAPRPVGPFEPARMSVQPASIAAVPLPQPAPARSRLAWIPLPPVRPELEPTDNAAGQRPLAHPSRKHAPSRLANETKSKADADPIGVVSLVKKIVAGDKTAKPPAPAAPVAMPSPQPPQ